MLPFRAIELELYFAGNHVNTYLLIKRIIANALKQHQNSIGVAKLRLKNLLWNPHFKNTFIWWKLGIRDLEFVKKCGETKNYLEHSNSSVSISS